MCVSYEGYCLCVLVPPAVAATLFAVSRKGQILEGDRKDLKDREEIMFKEQRKWEKYELT